MLDRREVILNQEHRKVVTEKGISSIHTYLFPDALKEQALNAMDEYFTERALELLTYMANNRIECGMGKNGPVFLQMKNANYETLTARQLFENFL